MADTAKKKIVLPGSERIPLSGFQAAAPSDPNEKIEITVTLKPKAPVAVNRKPLSAKEFAARKEPDRNAVQRECAASEECVNRVTQFAKNSNLTVLSADAVKRAVVLSGTVKDFNAAFSTDLRRYEKQTEWYRGRTGPLEIPEELKNDVESVLGLDDRPQAKHAFSEEEDGRSPVFGRRRARVLLRRCSWGSFTNSLLRKMALDSALR